MSKPERKMRFFSNTTLENQVCRPKSGINLYPFGSPMPGRNYTSSNYRYGFNGQEKDDEIAGSGNSISFTHRIYDPRLGRFLSVDPLTKEYPWYTPYQFAGNTPIQAKDVEGLEPKSVIGETYSVKSKLGVQTFYRLNDAAVLLMHLATGVDSKALKETWLQVDQKFHDATTGYKSGAITMGKYIIFTGNYGDPEKYGNDTREWFDLLSHEVGHRQQANDRSPAGYFLGYLADALSAVIKNRSTDAGKIHDDLEMEKDAESRRTKFNAFMKAYEYKDSKGNSQNAIYDVLNNEKYDDKQKSQMIMDMYIQSTTPAKEEENTTTGGNGKG